MSFLFVAKRKDHGGGLFFKGPAEIYTTLRDTTLNIEGMVQNRRLSRSISDAGWGAFLGMLKYKAEWAGKHFVRIGRFIATSQLCSNCGGKQPMPLAVRTYACGGCGIQMDRDWNASLNIRAAGLAVLNACGGA